MSGFKADKDQRMIGFKGDKYQRMFYHPPSLTLHEEPYDLPCELTLVQEHILAYTQICR